MLHDDPEIELSQRRRFLGIIVSETERLTRLINQVLDMAKLESGRAEWTTGEVRVGDVVREAIEALGPLFRERPCSFRSISPSLCRWCWPIATA